MTPTTKEIMDKYQVRKTKKQKSAFIEWLRPVVERSGYEMNVEKGYLGVRNIVIGDPETAKVVFTAHYDTAPILPFPNLCTPLCIPLYIAFQLALVALMLLPTAITFFLTRSISLDTALCCADLMLLLTGFLLVCGPANKHTANDNTSGVTAVLDLMNAMPEHLRKDAAFLLFDKEEEGLLGSADYESRHGKTMKEKLLVNMDCVSDGETILFCFRKHSRKYAELFRKVFQADSRATTEFALKNCFYPSDQANFHCGVGIVALNKTKGGLLYLDKVHTSKDTVYREENIEYLVDGCVRLVESL